MIAVSGLTKEYGGRRAVDDVSFALGPGTVTGFLGPNGAGKTTTMRMVTGLVPATSGSALVDGQPYASLTDPGAVLGTLLDAGAVHPTDGETWVIDVTSLSGCDRIGLRTIGISYRRALRHGRRLALVGAGSPLQAELARVRLDRHVLADDDADLTHRRSA